MSLVTSRHLENCSSCYVRCKSVLCYYCITDLRIGMASVVPISFKSIRKFRENAIFERLYEVTQYDTSDL